jgi:gluconolactonase
MRRLRSTRRSFALGFLAWLLGCSGASDSGSDKTADPLAPFPSGGASAPPNTPAATSGSAAGSGVGNDTPPAGAEGLGPLGTEGNGNVTGIVPASPPPSGGNGGDSNATPPTPPSDGSGEQMMNPPAPPPANSNPGGFTSVPASGGAAAAFVCPKGVTFGSPLDGMGQVQQLAAPSGSFFAFIEGPVWAGSLNKLFFSDNASGPERIWQVSPPFTTPSIFLQGSGSNGLAIDAQDQLIVADQAQHRVSRVNSMTSQVSAVLVPTGNYMPNDVLVRSDGNIYFTDPNSAGRGLYRVSPAGALSGPFLPANAPNAPNSPNGVELSPDENTLYVGDVNAQFVAKFALHPDGSLDTTSGQMFARTKSTTPDGMSVDCAGNLYVGTQGGVEVYSPAGTLLGTVPTGESSNSTFGGADRRTLFVTSRAVLKFVTLAVPGLPD